MYAVHPEETRLAVLLMIAVGYYALPRAEGGRFPKALMCVIWEMIERNVTFSWAPAYLAELYRGLWACRRNHRTTLDGSYLLHCWVYEHIVCVRPIGQPIRSGETGVQRLGFRRWVQKEQEARSQAVTDDVEYYR